MNDKDTQEFMLGQGGVRTGSIMNEAGLSTRGPGVVVQPPPRSSGPTNPGVQKFLGATLIVLGLWFANPSPASVLGYWPYAFAGLGAYSFLLGVISGWRQPRARFIFFRFLPPWLILWVAMWSAVLSFGTPHLMVVQDNGRCSYLGLNGFLEVRDFSRPCDTFRNFPLTMTEIGDQFRMLASEFSDGR